MAEAVPSTREPCEVCGGPCEQPNVLHAWRLCEACGRPVYRVPGPDGLHVEAGENVTLPAGALRMSLDRNLSTGAFTRAGVTWFVEQLLRRYQPNDSRSIAEALLAIEEDAESLLGSSDLLADLDLEEDSELNAAVDRVEDNRTSLEFWAFGVAALVAQLRERLDAVDDKNDVAAASLRLGLAQAMLVYVNQLEPFVWAAYQTTGIAAMKTVLSFWDEHKHDSDEATWQQLFNDYPFVLSQVLPHPIVVIGAKAYVGGKALDNTGGQVADFLLAQAVSHNAALLELKNPAARLLGGKYRSGVYAPSRELSGAISQVLSQRNHLVGERHLLDDLSLVAFSPACVVVAGTSEELDTTEKRRSFELYRAALGGVTVLTFDELFLNLKTILDALTRS